MVPHPRLVAGSTTGVNWLMEDVVALNCASAAGHAAASWIAQPLTMAAGQGQGPGQGQQQRLSLSRPNSQGGGAPAKLSRHQSYPSHNPGPVLPDICGGVQATWQPGRATTPGDSPTGEPSE